jgi:hypothetical protein
MSVDPKHGYPDLGANTIPELEEHGHIGGVEGGPAFKSTYEAPVSTRVDEVDTDTAYIGTAVVGSSPASAVWRIRKIITENDVTSVLYADGDSLYDNVWNNRLSLTYS